MAGNDNMAEHGSSCGVKLSDARHQLPEQASATSLMLLHKQIRHSSCHFIDYLVLVSCLPLFQEDTVVRMATGFRLEINEWT